MNSLEIFEKILNEDDFMNRILYSLSNFNSQIADLEKTINRKKAEITKLKAKEDKLFDELLEGNENYKDKIRQRIQENSNKLEVIEGEIKSILKDIETSKTKSLNLDEISKLLKSAGKVIRLMDKETQKRLIRKLISKIVVKDKHISEIHFSFDEGFTVGYDNVNRTTNKKLTMYWI